MIKPKKGVVGTPDLNLVGQKYGRPGAAMDVEVGAVSCDRCRQLFGEGEKSQPSHIWCQKRSR